jgi:hypothetical protein
MKHAWLLGTVLLFAVLLLGCATSYQPESFTGGFSDYMTAPDEAAVTFRGNGYTGPERVAEMTALRCAEVTLQHGYRYFVIIGASDISRNFSFTTPGYATTHAYGTVSGFGNFGTVSGNAYTTVNPPQTFNFYKPAVMVAIKMSNNEKSLESLGTVINGQKARPKDAAFLSNSLRQYLSVKS